MNILLAAVEMAPFVTGSEQGDFANALTTCLTDLGHDVRVILPLSSAVRHAWSELHPEKMGELAIPFGKNKQVVPGVVLHRAILVDSGVELYLIESDEFFGASGVSVASGTSDAPGVEVSSASVSETDPAIENNWRVESARWSFLCQALLSAVSYIDFVPDIFHFNDYQLAPAVVMLRWGEYCQAHPKASSVLTIHDLTAQGLFPRDEGVGRRQMQDHLRSIGLSTDWYRRWGPLEVDDRINYLKAGVKSADLITVASPAYARLIQKKGNGCGLEEEFNDRSTDLVGILNGVDESLWHPKADPLIPYNFERSTLRRKQDNKSRLLEVAHFPPDLSVPLVAVCGELTDEKGLDLLAGMADEFLGGAEVRMLALGSGSAEYEDLLQDLALRYPHKMAVYIGDNEPLSHLLMAGADFMLIPSPLEPGRLNQLVCMRYGTVPVVYAEAGFGDTVTEFLPGVASGDGIVFRGYDPESLREALERVVAVYREKPVFRALVARIMGLDFSWRVTALAYERAYERVLELKE